jgi:hypothetical protein
MDLPYVRYHAGVDAYMLPSEANAAGGIRAGMDVELLCSMRGLTIGIPMMQNCVFAA